MEEEGRLSVEFGAMELLELEAREDKKGVKSVFLCWLGRGESSKSSAIVWYKINPHEDTKDSPRLLQPVSEEYPGSKCGSAGCLGSSRIYLFGGHVRPIERDVMGLKITIPRSKLNDEIHFIDTEDSSSSEKTTLDWKNTHLVEEQLSPGRLQLQSKVIKMLSKRSATCSVAIGKRIYIFGSEHDYNSLSRIPAPWAEVFDTSSGLCTPLPNPPLQLLLHTRGVYASVVLDNGKKILLVAHASFHCSYKPSKSKRDLVLFIYDVINNCWESGSDLLQSPPSRLILPIISPRNAVLDNILYTFNLGRVHAFDLEKKEWFPGYVQGLLENVEISEYGSPYGFVHDLGNGDLFLIYTTHADSHFQQHCEAFKPVIVEDDLGGGGRYIRAEVHSSACYLILDRHRYALVDSVPL